MKVSLYVRTSTEQHQTTQNQIQVLNEFCTSMGYEVVKIYDDKVSGGTDNRPAFQQMFDDASKRKFDMVLFWSLDRFSREGTRATIHHLERLDSYGVGYRSYTEQYLDSCGIFKDVVISLLSTLAKQERVRMSERVKAGLKRTDKKLGRPSISTNVTTKIIQLKEGGLSHRKIGEQLGISHTSVARTLKMSI